MPSQDLQVGRSQDDAFERSSGAFNTVGVGVFIIQNVAAATASSGGFLLQGVNIVPASVIFSASVEFFAYDAGNDDPEFILYGNDVDNANNFVDEADIIGRARTVASVVYSAVGVGVGWYGGAIDISPIIQEIVNKPGFVSGNDLALLAIALNVGPNKLFLCRSWDFDPNLALKLHIVWAPPRTAKLGGVLERHLGGSISS